MLTVFSMSFSHLLGLLPTINIPVVTINPIIMDIINALWYFLPMETIGNIAGLSFSLSFARLIFAAVLRVKSFIPFSGGA